MKKVNIGVLVGIAVLGMVGITIFSLVGTGMGAGKYTTFDKAKENGETAHIAGQWVRQNEAHYDGNIDLFRFYMADSTNKIQLVHYQEPMPVNFKEAERIVVEGAYKDEVFLADKIFMKCPSKYNETKITSVESGDGSSER